MSSTNTLRQLSFFVRFLETLERLRTTDKVHRFALRDLSRFFGAEEGCIALYDRLRRGPCIELETKQKVQWDLELFANFIKNRRPRIPQNVIMAPLKVRRKIVGLLALRKGDGFGKGDGKFLCRLVDRVSAELSRREEMRILTVRAGISKDIMRGLRPKDVFYKLLDGLEELLRYDHSAAILILDGDKDAFVVQAEKITWRKGKSAIIGLELPTDPAVNGFLLNRSTPLAFDRNVSGDWRAWGSPYYVTVLRILDYNKDRSAPSENSILCVPLRSKGQLIGLLKISSRVPEAFGRDDIQVVQEFLPQAEAAILASQFSASLHERTIESEKRLGILEIARGVAHDVNNALGAVIPLVQSIISDLKDSCANPEELLKDMRYIEENVRLCARIFGSMLGYAKAAESGHRVYVDVKKSIHDSMRLLDRGLNTRGVSVTMEIEENLPSIEADPTRLQQAFFNIVTNARDAMPNGGILKIRAWRDGKILHVSFEDTGVGINKEDLNRVMEPFFTTKKDGTGLGLSICRSIVWESNGRMRIESEPGKGTTVFIDFPAAESEKSGTGA
jgi:signal transduction histidine kinase